MSPVDALRVDVSYRPLRIACAITAGDLPAFRTAVRQSYALWGGRFNPIVIVDHDDEARRLVDLFRVDVIRPLGSTASTNAFAQSFPHLNDLFLRGPLFLKGLHGRTYTQVLDVNNLMFHYSDTSEWNALKARNARLYSWAQEDALADSFLIQFGEFPSPDATTVDYRSMFSLASQASTQTLDLDSPIPADIFLHPSIPALSRFGLTRHYAVRARSDLPGVFVGRSDDIADLVCYWNLRAADITVLFVDQRYLPRYSEVIPAWSQWLQGVIAGRPEWDRHMAIWSRQPDISNVLHLLPDIPTRHIHVSSDTWNGTSIQVPTMHLGQTSVLGVVGHDKAQPRISFALNDKPFCGDILFHTQHLVASIGCGLYGEQRHTLSPPYVPELNERWSRIMQRQPDTFRLEPNRLGLVIDAADKDAFLYGLPVADLMEGIFGLAGYQTRLSGAGLIVQQLLTHLGGIQGARVFKIPGVRRLLRTHGPNAVFTKDGALQLIGGPDPKNPGASFADHKRLFIEPRSGESLTPSDVFDYLVAKGLFRIGADLTCPHCRMSNWTALDSLKQHITCELCGQAHDATRQLVNSTWHYRRSGIMGAERGAQGAVPVALTLQQLGANLHDTSQARYSASLDLTPKVIGGVPKCEIDFVWMQPRSVPHKTVLIIGECKDRGPIPEKDFKRDVNNLRAVAAAIPQQRFETYILLTKLAAFTAYEVSCARVLNENQPSPRVILLTDRELEPYNIFDRHQVDQRTVLDGSTVEDLANSTYALYFETPVA